MAPTPMVGARTTTSPTANPGLFQQHSPAASPQHQVAKTLDHQGIIKPQQPCKQGSKTGLWRNEFSDHSADLKVRTRARRT
ncbi:hypothetical protein AABB02_38470 [Streptomyces rimosus]|uniref:hypothetical protein n=1 Tax=Streptomyces rimosus TaxID=1927 RepID=UPI0031D784AD